MFQHFNTNQERTTQLYLTFLKIKNYPVSLNLSGTSALRGALEPVGGFCTITQCLVWSVMVSAQLAPTAACSCCPHPHWDGEWSQGRSGLRQRQISRPGSEGKIIIIMMIKQCTKQAIHITCHCCQSLGTDSCPMANSPGLCAEVWNIPVASPGQLCWLCSLPAPCASAHWPSTRNWKVLDLEQEQLSTTKTSACYQHYSLTESKTQHWTSYQEEN